MRDLFLSPPHPILYLEVLVLSWRVVCVGQGSDPPACPEHPSCGAESGSCALSCSLAAVDGGPKVGGPEQVFPLSQPTPGPVAAPWAVGLGGADGGPTASPTPCSAKGSPPARSAPPAPAEHGCCLGVQEGRWQGPPHAMGAVGDARGLCPSPARVTGGFVPLPELWLESQRVKLELRFCLRGGAGGGPQLLFHTCVCRGEHSGAHGK